MTYPMGNAPNIVTQPAATPIVTPADMTFQPNMTARPADEKKRATRIVQPSQIRWAAPNATASTTNAPDGVGGPIKQVW
eukprot:scaffold92242_cov31-Attheya_sp.AAC.2